MLNTYFAINSDIPFDKSTVPIQPLILNDVNTNFNDITHIVIYDKDRDIFILTSISDKHEISIVDIIKYISYFYNQKKNLVTYFDNYKNNLIEKYFFKIINTNTLSIKLSAYSTFKKKITHCIILIDQIENYYTKHLETNTIINKTQKKFLTNILSDIKLTLINNSLSLIYHKNINNKNIEITMYYKYISNKMNDIFKHKLNA